MPEAHTFWESYNGKQLSCEQMLWLFTGFSVLYLCKSLYPGLMLANRVTFIHHPRPAPPTAMPSGAKLVEIFGVMPSIVIFIASAYL